METKPVSKKQQNEPVDYADATRLKFPQFMLFLVGMPVKLRQSIIHVTPWTTWALVLAIIAVSMSFWYDEATRELLAALIFRPERQGFAWLTGLFGHVFLHADWIHLLGNMYFLWLFGRNIECCFGRRRLLGLFFLSAALGALLHTGFTDRGLAGASGGVFGVLVFYVCQFPQARVVWAPGLLMRGILLVVARKYLQRGLPVAVFIALFGGLQLLILYEQLFMDGRVSAMAHLGGGLAGLLIWLAWRADWVP